MKKKAIILAALLVAFAMPSSAQSCEIHLTVAPMQQGENVPEGFNDLFTTRLANAISATGVVADPNFDRFFVAGKFNHVYKETLPGPPMQTAVHSTLTLYIGDALNQQVYASTTFDVRGVGTSEERALINAVSRIDGKNRQLLGLLDKGKQKILEFYNTNYQQYLQRAQRAASLKQYDEALYYATAIPECCNGYAEASKLTQKYFQNYLDFNGQKLLQQARAAWSVHPDEQGAAQAWNYLLQIDPDAACYREATQLANEIKKTVKANWDFENRQKYKDQIDLEKSRISAARAVGVAWGNGQKPKTTYLNFIR